jgi:hypothetical protein
MSTPTTVIANTTRFTIKRAKACFEKRLKDASLKGFELKVNEGHGHIPSNAFIKTMAADHNLRPIEIHRFSTKGNAKSTCRSVLMVGLPVTADSKIDKEVREAFAASL